MTDREKQFNKSFWTTKRIISAILITPLYLFWLLITIITFIDYDKVGIQVIWFIGLLALFTYGYVRLVVPKYFKCMDAVREYLSFRSFNSLIKKENFVPVQWEPLDKNKHRVAKISHSEKKGTPLPTISPIRIQRNCMIRIKEQIKKVAKNNVRKFFNT